MADMALVYDVLHVYWGKSSWWAHVKKVKDKNDQQVWRIFHTVLLGGNRITTTGSAIVAPSSRLSPMMVTRRTSTLTSM